MKQQTWRHLAVCSTAVVAAALSFSAAAGAVPSFKDVPAILGDSDFCIGRQDGSYEHPDCRVRYSCKRGIASQTTCPDGQVFDPTKNLYDNSALSYCSAPESVKHVDCSNLVK